MTSSAPRGAAGLLRDPTFRRYFVGSLSSNTGTWFQNVAAILTIFALTRSAVMVGLVTAMQFAMQLLLAPWMGAVADKADRRRMVIVGQVLGAMSATTLAVVGFLDVLNPPVILGMVALAGVGQAVSGPAAQALVANLVTPAEIPQAIALHSVTFNLSRAIGPVAGAATYALGGPGTAFLLNALSYVVFIVALLTMRVPKSSRPRAGRSLGLLGGVAYAREHPQVLLLLAAVALLAFAMEPVTTLSPLFAERFGGGDLLVGLFMTCFGVGSAVIAFWVGSLRRRIGGGRAGAVGMVVLGAGMLTLAASDRVGVALVALGVSGAGYLLATTDVTSSIQQGLDDGVRGRVMALWSMAFLGTRPIGAMVHGWLGDTLSAAAGAAAAVAAAVAAAALVLLAAGSRIRTTTDASSFD